MSTALNCLTLAILVHALDVPEEWVVGETVKKGRFFHDLDDRVVDVRNRRLDGRWQWVEVESYKKQPSM